MPTTASAARSSRTKVKGTVTRSTALDQTITQVRPDGSTTKLTYDPAANAADRCYSRPPTNAAQRVTDERSVDDDI